MKALVVIDMQNDFMPDGSLPVPNGDKIIPKINELMSKFDMVLFSKDWHDPNMKVFKNGVWPEHCIAGTPGSDFPKELKLENIKDKFYIFKKGLELEIHPYSIFEAEGFNDFLKDNNIDELYFCGVAGDYCVFESVSDSIHYNYKTYVYKDAIKNIKYNPIPDFKRMGVNII